MKKLVLALTAFYVLSAAPAEARRHHYHRHHHDGRPGRWCGWWMGQHLGVHDRSLWLAKNWRHYGRDAGGPGVGVVVVWAHHVGQIVGQAANGMWLVLSGNDGNAVRTRPRSLRGAIAFRS